MSASVDVVILPARTFILGEKKYVGVYLTQNLSATFTPTATVAIYDSAGTATLSATSMTVTAGVRARARYLLTTGAAMNITAAGTYRAIYTVTLSSEVQIWEQQITVLASPF